MEVWYVVPHTPPHLPPARGGTPVHTRATPLHLTTSRDDVVNPDDWPVTSGRLIARACAPPRVTQLPDTEDAKEQRRRAFPAAGPRTSNPFHMDFERRTRGARSRTPTRME